MADKFLAQSARPGCIPKYTFVSRQIAELLGFPATTCKLSKFSERSGSAGGVDKVWRKEISAPYWDEVDFRGLWTRRRWGLVHIADSVTLHSCKFFITCLNLLHIMLDLLIEIFAQLSLYRLCSVSESPIDSWELLSFWQRVLGGRSCSAEFSKAAVEEWSRIRPSIDWEGCNHRASTRVGCVFLTPEVLDNVCKTIFLVYVRMQVPWKLQGAIFENGFVNKNGAEILCFSNWPGWVSSFLAIHWLACMIESIKDVFFLFCWFYGFGIDWRFSNGSSEIPCRMQAERWGVTRVMVNMMWDAFI